MTNWDKIKDVIKGMYDCETKEEFAEILSEAFGTCRGCALTERCNKLFYKHDEDGYVITDDAGDPILDDDFPGCDKIILSYLNEEVKE